MGGGTSQIQSCCHKTAFPRWVDLTEVNRAHKILDLPPACLSPQAQQFHGPGKKKFKMVNQWAKIVDFIFYQWKNISNTIRRIGFESKSYMKTFKNRYLTVDGSCIIKVTIPNDPILRRTSSTAINGSSIEAFIALCSPSLIQGSTTISW